MCTSTHLNTHPQMHLHIASGEYSPQTQPVVSAPLGTQPVVSAPLGIQPVVSAPLGTQSVASATLTFSRPWVPPLALLRHLKTPQPTVVFLLSTVPSETLLRRHQLFMTKPRRAASFA